MIQAARRAMDWRLLLSAGAVALALVAVTACASAAAGRSVAADGGETCEFQGSADAGISRALQSAVSAADTRLGLTTALKAGIAPDPNSFSGTRCSLIAAAGYQFSPAISALANRDPRQRFLVADDWFDFSSAPTLTRRNVSVLAFEADQGSFLAGYVAAAVSSNHVVGEYGSLNVPTVDVALNGFLAGARAWRKDFE
jgi:basic membrane protein A and related proteins